MKKVSLTLLIALVFAFSANAQLKNKHGEVILPETGDWAIGVDAAPILGYFGNMLNGTTNNNMSWGFTNGSNAIFGKYFTSETEAYRVGLRIGFVNQTTKNNILATDSMTAPMDNRIYVEDKATQHDMNIVLSAGKEWRRGHGRLQGFYGADVYVMLGSSSTSFSYGNALDSTAENSTDWSYGSGIAPIANPEGLTGNRITKAKFGTTFGMGVRGFIGAEYFVLPKLSIGGEFGWGLGFQSRGKGTETNEHWDFTGKTLTTYEEPGQGSSSFAIDTDNFSGAIKLMFHF